MSVASEHVSAIEEKTSIKYPVPNKTTKLKNDHTKKSAHSADFLHLLIILRIIQLKIPTIKIIKSRVKQIIAGNPQRNWNHEEQQGYQPNIQ